MGAGKTFRVAAAAVENRAMAATSSAGYPAKAKP